MLIDEENGLLSKVIILDWFSGKQAIRRYSSDAFVEDYAKHHVQLSGLQRTVLTAGAAALSLADPFRADMIACLGETTGASALSHCLHRMKSSSEGQRILSERPRIHSSTIELSALKNLPEGTLGKTYHNFLDVNVRHLVFLFVLFLNPIIDEIIKYPEMQFWEA